MQIAYGNIRKTLSTEQVASCARKARRFEVVGFSEIKNQADSDGIIAGLGDRFTIKNFGCSNPIAFNKEKYELTPTRKLPASFHQNGIVQLHAGDSDIPTPERTASWVILSDLQRAAIPPVAFWCGHLINKAWNGKEHDEEVKRQRQILWWEAFEEWRWRVNTFLRAGITCVWMGDFNRHYRRMMPFFYAQERLSIHGIDQMYAARGRNCKSARFKCRGEREIDNKSDHHMIVSNVSFYAP